MPRFSVRILLILTAFLALELSLWRARPAWFQLQAAWLIQLGLIALLLLAVFVIGRRVYRCQANGESPPASRDSD